ncbi:aromatic acid exporter family protein [Paenibacillus albiflavus]|uniref:Aromatic acid exporter family protein n=1 Tax=Paenibacillus albiflavus TaxID=2545760 RepID=A0A4R4ENP6_9BACL|nr:aromatic acid exporter family protein [Paenibacillus albiflavus]
MLSTKELIRMVIVVKFVGIIGIRVLKTAIAVFISISIAKLCGLHSPESAGLLAILGIQVTKKQGIRNVMARICASLVSLVFGVILYMTLGFHYYVLALYVLVAFPVIHRLKFGDGIITGSVVFYHLYFAKEISVGVLVNELLLLLIGLGISTLINIVYMPQMDSQLKKQKEQIDRLFSIIFSKFALHLRDTNTVWNGAEILDAEAEIDKGIALAKKRQDNVLFSDPISDWHIYFFMRSEQLAMVERMSSLLATVYQSMPQGHSLATIFEEVADDVKHDYYVGRAENDLTLLENHFRSLPMPESRNEFEVRSSLFQLIRELKAYLNIAKKEQEHHKSSRSF